MNDILYGILGLPAQGGLNDSQFAPFNPEGLGYDYETAVRAGMTPYIPSMVMEQSYMSQLNPEEKANIGHWGSVAPVPNTDMYQMLKGASHETFPLGVAGEESRGYKVVKIGDKYYSVPNTGLLSY